MIYCRGHVVLWINENVTKNEAQEACLYQHGLKRKDP